jgi:hypothetical protein
MTKTCLIMMLLIFGILVDIIMLYESKLFYLIIKLNYIILTIKG